MVAFSDDLSIQFHAATRDKGQRASKLGYCKEPVRVFHFKQLSTADTNDVKFFSTQLISQKN